jgi:hypothetical protein
MSIINQNSYPLLSFPPRIRDAAEEIMQIVQVTDIIACTSCLTALSIAGSPNVDWKHPATGQTHPAVVNQAIAAISGDRKSTAEGLACRPTFEYDKASILAQKEEAKTYKRAKVRWKVIQKKVLAQYTKLAFAGEATTAEDLLSSLERFEPNPPEEHRILHENMTHLSAFEALEGDGKAIALLTDEGQTLLESTVMRHYGFLNNAWDGKPLLTIDRAKHENLIVQNPRVTVSFMVQPAVLNKFMTKHGEISQKSGFWARYLISRSPTIQGYRKPILGTPVLIRLLPFHARLNELMQTYRSRLKSGDVTRDVLEFDDAAKVLWWRISSQVEANLLPGYYLRDIGDFANKYMDQVGRIACLFHYFGADTDSLSVDPITRTEQLGKISYNTLECAAAIAEWHLHEYKQVFAPALLRTPEEFDADRLYAMLYRTYYMRGTSETMKNRVRQYSGLKGDGRFNDALEILRGWQAITTASKHFGNGKKPTEVILLNFNYFSTHPLH